MNSEDESEWIERYNQRFSEFGIAPEALGWGGGQARQVERFRAALGFTHYSTKEVSSILDVGCGFGDLGAWLRGAYPTISYQGIDINPLLVEKGKAKHHLDLTTSTIDSFLVHSHDLVVANGIFNFRLRHEDHESYITRTLSGFLEHARIGIAVDFMSIYVDFAHENAFHCPEELVIETVKKYTRRYVIRNDYLDFEYMVYAYL
jgi:SAM-dependent methyltransferase